MIRQCQCGHLQFRRTRNELLHFAGTVEQTVLGVHVQMDEGREHEAIMKEGVGKSNSVTPPPSPVNRKKLHFFQTTAATATA